MKKMIIFVLFLFTASVCFAQPKHGGTLRLTTTSDPKTFNIIIAQETSTTEAVGLLFEGLTRVNAVTTETEPCLAVSWTHSEDGLEWIFKLREGVKWFDGQNFTADDVVFTYNDLIYNKDIPCSSRDIFTVEGKPFKVEKLDTYKIKITTPTPYAPLLFHMGESILPKHILEQSVKEGKFSEMWGVNTSPSKLIGTGPFRLAEYLPSQRLVYERNPYYWRKDNSGSQLPYIEKIVTYIVQNLDAQILKFRAGETDIASVQGKDYALIKSEEKNKGYTVYDCGPSFGTDFIAFNLQKLKFANDPRFRQAVAYALDRQSMINNILSGMGAPQYAAMNESAKFFYNPSVKKYEYNPEKAKELIKEMGFTAPPKFTLLTNAENNIRVDIGAIIQSDLKAIGMDVSFRPLDFNNLVTKLNYTRDWEAILIGFTGGIEPHSGKNVWATDGHLHIWNMKPQTDADLKTWEDSLQPWEKEIDELFNRGVKELDPEKRKQIYWKWQEIAASNLPLIYTINSEAIYAVRNNIKNIHPTAYGGVLHNIEEIYIEKDK